jgi:hypothetical protein
LCLPKIVRRSSPILIDQVMNSGLLLSSSLLATALAFHPNGKVVSPSQLLHLHGAKTQHRALALETFHNMTFDEDSRDLKVRNNFFSFSWYTGSCNMAPSDVHGYLVNYCFNTGGGNSFVVKVNKKEEFYTELKYENDNCHGVPSAIHDITWYKFGECGEASLDGASVKFEYLSDYPTSMYTGMNQYTYEMYLCDSGNFNSFNWSAPSLLPSLLPHLPRRYTSGVCGLWGDFSLKVSECDVGEWPPFPAPQSLSLSLSL